MGVVMHWVVRTLVLALIAGLGFGLWFVRTFLTANSAQVKPERGVPALAARKGPGFGVNAGLRIDLTGEDRISPSGKPVAASLIVARDGCMNLDQPLVGFNWWTLRGWWSAVLLARYQMYAAQ